jgi:DNA replication protein DnaC
MKACYEDRLLQDMSIDSPLLLDDLGVEVPDRAGGFMYCLFEIINQIWANAAKTIISTNLSPSALHERYASG